MDYDSVTVDPLLWGKSKDLPEGRQYPLIWHLVDTAAVALVIWDHYLTAQQRRIIASGLGTSEEHARRLVAFWAALHDLGKAIPSFQAKDKAAYEKLRATGRYPEDLVFSRDTPHNEASQLLVVNLLKAIGYDTKSWPESPAYRCSQILGGHHGRFQSKFEKECLQAERRYPYLGQGEWQAQRKVIFHTVHRLLGEPAPPPIASADAAALVTGVIILADWLASQKHFITQRLGSVPEKLTVEDVERHFKDTLHHAPDLLTTAGLGTVDLVPRPFNEIYPFAPNPLQQSLLEELTPHLRGPGLLIVTAATGHGKTEAALTTAAVLAKASHASGLYFALPTMATAEAMYDRVRSFAERCVSGHASMTRLHSMAWVNSRKPAAEQLTPTVGIVSDDPDEADDSQRASVAIDWLRGRARPMLANLTVGTIDQALMAVLQSKHNVLRLLGLSSKVFVVDEAHSYDPYMQTLLEALLAWLGKLRCSVILLSATLPSSLAGRLASAYAEGSGRGTLPEDDVTAPYPGWTFLPADTSAPVLTISPRRQQAVAAHRRFSLAIDVHPMRHATPPTKEDTKEDSEGIPDRLTAIQRVLAPLVEERDGCAAVICNTVDDAQTTYVHLREALDPSIELHLLHARMPMEERERRVDALERRYGKNSTRPAGVVVATQLIEQSLDLDFDCVISDLAPIAQLLQRAGRCWRHHGARRPRWSHGARLVVLDPVDSSGQFQPAAGWAAVYGAYPLRVAHDLLVDYAGTSITVPDDVQTLVESASVREHSVEAPCAVDAPAWDERLDHQANRQAQRATAQDVMISYPENVGDLGSLHDKTGPEQTLVDLATRFGADTARAIVCYVDEDGRRWLDARCTEPMPEEGEGEGGEKRLPADDVRTLLQRSIQLPRSYVRGAGAEHQPPPAWRNSVWLRDIVLLPHRVSGTCIAPARLGDRYFLLDPALGLVVRSSPPTCTRRDEKGLAHTALRQRTSHR